jgi:hypothetical protein
MTAEFFRTLLVARPLRPAGMKRVVIAGLIPAIHGPTGQARG